jgi:hypothetical protein
MLLLDIHYPELPHIEVGSSFKPILGPDRNGGCHGPHARKLIKLAWIRVYLLLHFNKLIHTLSSDAMLIYELDFKLLICSLNSSTH